MFALANQKQAPAQEQPIKTAVNPTGIIIAIQYTTEHKIFLLGLSELNLNMPPTPKKGSKKSIINNGFSNIVPYACLNGGKIRINNKSNNGQIVRAIISDALLFSSLDTSPPKP